MFKTMFVDNWFSTLGGLAAAAVQFHSQGMSWRVAAFAALGLIIKDGVPSLTKFFGKETP